MHGSHARRLDIPRTTGIIARLAFALAVKEGADVETLLKRSGLSRELIDDPNTRLEVQSQIKFLDLVSQAIGDDLLGFHLSQQFDPRRIGLGYYVLASSQTLGEALRNAAKYTSTIHEGIRLTLREGRQFSVNFEYVSVARHPDRHQIEFWIAAIVRICRQITNRRLDPERVCFTHRRRPSRELNAYFGCEITFGSNVDEAIFSPSIRDLAVVGSDPYLNRVLVKFCEQSLGHRKAARRAFAPTVENTIASLMPRGKAQAAEVARKLGLSQKTLERRLCSEGFRFAGLRQRLQCDLAKRHLADKDLPISKIAWLLGYQGVGAFSNAFKRWTGTTPRTFRQELH